MNFERAKAEVIVYTVEDIVTASPCGADGCPTHCPADGCFQTPVICDPIND